MKTLQTLKTEMLTDKETNGEYDALAGERLYAELSALIAEAYQVIGCLAVECGRFDDPHVIKVLDNLAAERMVHDDVLPFPSRPPAPAMTV